MTKTLVCSITLPFIFRKVTELAHRPGGQSLFRIQAMGESVYTLLARLAATANIRQGRETAFSTPSYFKCTAYHDNPSSKI